MNDKLNHYVSKTAVSFFVSLLAVGVLYGASTIGANIVTTGTLEVTGASTLGSVTMTSASTTSLTVTDSAYSSSGWDGSSAVPTKNAIRDKIENLIIGEVNALNLDQTTPQTVIGGAPIFSAGASFGDDGFGGTVVNLDSGGSLSFAKPASDTYTQIKVEDNSGSSIYPFFHVYGQGIDLMKFYPHGNMEIADYLWVRANNNNGDLLRLNRLTDAENDYALIINQNQSNVRTAKSKNMNWTFDNSSDQLVASINKVGQASFSQVVVGNSASTTAGAIRFDGTHFYGYDGAQWKQLDN